MPDTRRPLRRSVHFYGLLLHLYPGSFRRQFGPSMRCTFRRWLLDEARRDGPAGVRMAWRTTALELIPSVSRAHADAAINTFRSVFSSGVLQRVVRGIAAGLLPCVAYFAFLRFTTGPADILVLNLWFVLMTLGMISARGRGWACTNGAILGTLVGLGLPMLWIALTENTMPSAIFILPLLLTTAATIALILASYVRLVVEGICVPRHSFA